MSAVRGANFPTHVPADKTASLAIDASRGASSAWTIVTADSLSGDRHQQAVLAAHRALFDVTLRSHERGAAAGAALDSFAAHDQLDAVFHSDSPHSSGSEANTSPIIAPRDLLKSGRHHRPRRVTFSATAEQQARLRTATSHQQGLCISDASDPYRRPNSSGAMSRPAYVNRAVSVGSMPRSADEGLNAPSSLSLDLSSLQPRGSLPSTNGRQRPVHRHSGSMSSIGMTTPPVDDADLGFFRLDQQRNGPLHRIREEEGRMRRESAQSARPTEAELVKASGRRSRSCSFTFSSPPSRSNFPTPPLTTATSIGSPSSAHGGGAGSGSWRWPSLPVTPSSLSPRSSAHYFVSSHYDAMSGANAGGAPKPTRLHSFDAAGLQRADGHVDVDVDGSADDAADEMVEDSDLEDAMSIRAESPPSFQLDR